MNPDTQRYLHRIANVGLIFAVVLGTLPFGMKAYGYFSQSLAHRRFTSAQNALTSSKKFSNRAIKYVTPLKTPPRRPWETAVLQIPSLGVDAVVTEGAGKWELVIGPGHMPGTAGPGGAGNCVIGAHRNLWDAAFADLPRVKPGDVAYIINSKGKSIYLIDSVREVRTENKLPLSRTKDARLTLVTCVLPFDRHKRWVAQGHLVVEKS